LILDKTHKPWFIISSLLLVVATAWFIFIQYSEPHGVTGGSISGLLFGIIGTLMMVFAGLLSVRKSFPATRLGSAQFWLRGHLWLGILSVPFILFHAGFGWGGPLEVMLLILFAVVVVTGIYGIILQHILPRMLTVQVPMETFIEQIPYLCKKTQVFADRMIAQQCGPVSLKNDPLLTTFKDVMKHWNSTSDKAIRVQWIDVVSNPLRPLIRDVAKHAKNKWGMRAEADFPKAIEEIYKFGFSQPAVEESNPSPDEDSLVQQVVAPAVKQATAGSKPPIPRATLPAANQEAPVAPHPRADILKKFYLEIVRPFLGDSAQSRPGPLTDEFESRRMFSHIRTALPQQFHETLDTLQEYCEQRRQFATQSRIHWWLHSWLAVHVPASMALFVLLIAHVIMALRVVPFGS
jgi:hypothetical protein